MYRDTIRRAVNIVLGATLALASARASAQYVTTFAGSGARATVDGAGPLASFDFPRDVAVDGAGNVYVTEGGNSTGVVRKISPSGLVSTLPGTFRNPRGVVADPTGDVYVSEQSYYSYGGTDGDIMRIAPDGRVTKFATLSSEAWWVAGMARDAAGNLLVADAGDIIDIGMGKVLRISPAGVVTRLTGPGTPFQVQNPWCVAVDGAGNLYVTDNGSALKLGVGGSTRILASGLKFSQGIAVAPSGTVYVAETGGNRILGIAPDGTVSVVAGSGLAGDADGPGDTATFRDPMGLALDGTGNLYVADNGNNRIRRIHLGSGSTDWTVPSVARTRGPNDSFWTSDLTVHNRGSAPASVTFKFLGHDADGGEGPEKDVTIGRYQTLTYADVLASVFGIGEGWGALRVHTASDQIAVRSRTSTLRAGGSIGDGVPGVRIDRFFSDMTTPTPVLTGLHEDERFRSNLVLVNGSAVPVEILVAALDSEGAALGSRTYALRAFEMIQDSRFLARTEFGAAPRTDVTVSVSTATPGGNFTAYAALIDNGSNAPTTVLPQ